MTTEKFGVAIKSPTGRFLTAAARAAVRLEAGLLGRSNAEIARRYGICPQRVGKMVKSVPDALDKDVGVAGVVAAARAAWRQEDGQRASEASWTLVLLDALALVIGDPSLTASSYLNAAVRHAGVAINTILETAPHAG
jgi:hypothetical protein